MNKTNQSQPPSPPKKGKKKTAQLAMELVKDLKLMTDGKNCYVNLKEFGGPTRVTQIPSNDFNSWLDKAYLKAHFDFLSTNHKKAVSNILRAKALESEKKVKVARRFAAYQGEFYIDLAENSDEVIIIDKTGWKIGTQKNALFVTDSSMKPIMRPTKGGDPLKLFKYLNVPNRMHQLFILTWLASLPLPFIRPMLSFQGQHASGKTTAGERLRLIFDPAEPLINSMPQSLADQVLVLYKNPICLFDNMSGINKHVADLLCKAITGGGHQKRALWHDSTLIHYDYVRPIIMTSIYPPSNRQDFLSRVVTIPFPGIQSGNRIKPSTIKKEFENDLPEITGGILDLLVEAMNRTNKTQLNQRTRMGDFDELGCAICHCLGVHPKKFMETRLELENEISVEEKDRPFINALLQMLNERNGAM